MIELTEQQRQAIEQARERPPTIVDPATNTAYVLVRKDLYERLLGGPYDDTEISDEELRYRLARSSPANGWEEPGMDAYDRYDEERKKQCP
jgi:hypothetical protein